MTKKRIRQLANFFYSSDNATDVPLRICCSTGRYTGFDLGQEDFIELLLILSRSDNLKADLATFMEDHHE